MVRKGVVRRENMMVRVAGFIGWRHARSTSDPSYTLLRALGVLIDGGSLVAQSLPDLGRMSFSRDVGALGLAVQIGSGVKSHADNFCRCIA
jgi:hypothetical protein